MPKQIEDLDGKILESCRRLLPKYGYAGLTIRKVASDCGIAVGTVYNYYASKELLIASVILKDWLGISAEMERVLPSVASADEGCCTIFDGIRRFIALYTGIWTEYSNGEKHTPSMILNTERHSMLIDQLSAMTGVLYERFGDIENETERTQVLLPRFLAETILRGALTPDLSYPDLSPVLLKLI